MKKLTIKNFGPLKEAMLDFSSINLIIGMQSSGKSCAMMVACFCSWVEKRIALRQTAEDFEEGTYFIDMMTTYYHSKGYVHSDTYIEYQSAYMSFSYEHKNEKFTHKWDKNRHWKFKRPKVSYVPAERNMISLVANWSKLETSYDNILDFKSDWDIARKFMKHEGDILGTGISYEYDEKTGIDRILTTNGIPLDLENSSSGVQSLVPQFVHLDYLNHGIYDTERQEKDKTFTEKQFIQNLLDILYKRNYNKKIADKNDVKRVIVHKEGKDYVFNSQIAASDFQKEADAHLLTDHVEVFLEEPESNLFPPTQFQLMDWIVEMSSNKLHKNLFFIATHSPYVLNYLLQENIDDFCLFLTYRVENGLYAIKTASDDDIQQIYDNGSDAFFNFDVFTKE